MKLRKRAIATTAYIFAGLLAVTKPLPLFDQISYLSGKTYAQELLPDEKQAAKPLQKKATASAPAIREVIDMIASNDYITRLDGSKMLRAAAENGLDISEINRRQTPFDTSLVEHVTCQKGEAAIHVGYAMAYHYLNTDDSYALDALLSIKRTRRTRNVPVQEGLRFGQAGELGVLYALKHAAERGVPLVSEYRGVLKKMAETQNGEPYLKIDIARGILDVLEAPPMKIRKTKEGGKLVNAIVGISSSNQRVQHSAVTILRRAGENGETIALAVPALIKLLDNADKEIKKEILSAFNSRGMRSALESTVRDERYYAARAFQIAARNNVDISDAIDQLLKDECWCDISVLYQIRYALVFHYLNKREYGRINATLHDDVTIRALEYASKVGYDVGPVIEELAVKIKTGERHCNGAVRQLLARAAKNTDISVVLPGVTEFYINVFSIMTTDEIEEILINAILNEKSRDNALAALLNPEHDIVKSFSGKRASILREAAEQGADISAATSKLVEWANKDITDAPEALLLAVTNPKSREAAMSSVLEAFSEKTNKRLVAIARKIKGEERARHIRKIASSVNLDDPAANAKAVRTLRNLGKNGISIAEAIPELEKAAQKDTSWLINQAGEALRLAGVETPYSGIPRKTVFASGIGVIALLALRQVGKKKQKPLYRRRR